MLKEKQIYQIIREENNIKNINKRVSKKKNIKLLLLLLLLLLC